MKNLLAVFILSLYFAISSVSFCQQVPFLTGDVFTPIWHNPASYGTWNKFSVNTTCAFSNQNFTNGIGLINSDYKFEKVKSKIAFGTGINFYHHQLGFSRTTSGALNANIQFKLSDKIRLSIGIAPGLEMFGYKDAAWVGVDTLDPNLPPSNVFQTKFNLDAGLFLYTELFYFGFSAIQLNAPNYDEVNYQQARIFSLNTGYRIMFTRKWGMFPSLNVAFDGATVSASTLVLFYFLPSRITVGAGYSMGTSFKMALGYGWKNWRINYYLGIQFLNPAFNPGISHEIRLSFRKPADLKCSTCPDWLK